MNRALLDRIRGFGMSGLQVQDDLAKIESDMGVKLRNVEQPSVSREIEGYEQFPLSLRSEAIEMAEYYEVFFCLENTIRELVSGILVDEFGSDWWSTEAVKVNIRDEVTKRENRELDSSFSPRSDRKIDYSTFGELSQLITDNWAQFASIFDSKSAVTKVMAELNTLRGPIAHCCTITDLEKDRLRLVVRNWMRIVA